MTNIEHRYQQFVANMPAGVFMFDIDLRLMVAEGEDLRAHGIDPASITGQLIGDVVPPAAFQLLEGPYLAALAGRSDDFDYVSPVNGGTFRIRVRPLTDANGNVVGGMSLAVDVSEARALQSQLEHARHLVGLGSSVYERRSGWSLDDSLLRLWGLDGVSDPIDVIDVIVLPEDRAVTRSAWQGLLARGGDGAMDYRMRNPVTGAVLHIHCAAQVTLGPDRLLLTAVATHVDVTETMQARAENDRLRAESTVQRALLLRHVSGLLTATSNGIEVAIQNIAELASAVLGDGCLVRVLSADRRSVDILAVAHRHERERRAMVDWVATQSGAGVLGDCGALLEEVLRTGEARLQEGRRPEQPEPGAAQGSKDSGTGVHRVVAPIRHNGTVLGFVGLYREMSEPPYEECDADLVQVLADRVGATIDACRARDLAERERVGRRASDDRVLALTSDQRELVLQLDSTEARERALLAEAVHDEPLQLVFAAMLRLDNVRAQLPEQAAEQLDGVAQMLELSVERLRQLIVVLTPPDLTAGLTAALLGIAEAIFLGSDTTVQVTGPAHVDLDPTAKTTVYRIVREALVNARKHARAAHITLEVCDEDDAVRVRLSDDGIGIASFNARPGHLGVATMRARAAAANARLVIESTPGYGTLVDLVLPTRLSAAQSPGAAYRPLARPLTDDEHEMKARHR